MNLGKTCARGQVTLQGLYNPDRIQNPGKHTRGANTWSSAEGGGFQEITWVEAVNAVSERHQRRTSRTRSRSCWGWHPIISSIW